jgi:hypothetical protein
MVVDRFVDRAIRAYSAMRAIGGTPPWYPCDGWRMGLQRATDRVPPRWPDQDRPQQAHLDFRVPDIDPAAEHAAVDIGATRLDGAGQNWRVYAEPAGKPFCLVWPAWACREPLSTMTVGAGPARGGM